MKNALFILCTFLTSIIFSQDAKIFQSELNSQFASKDESPLTEDDLKEFKSLAFFPIDSSYIVQAQLKIIENAKPFAMQTTTARLPIYKVYAIATFQIEGIEYKLQIYQNQHLLLTDDFEDYLFLPFNDKTNEISTYGGGRYIDLEIPKTDIIWIDFNKAYNPYCAYNHKYSCPIPPQENQLPIEIKAGVKAYKRH